MALLREIAPVLTRSLFLLVFTGSLIGCGPSLEKGVEEAYVLLPEKVDYNFQVKPILADRCYACHGPDENARQGDLRLDLEADALSRLSSGKHAIAKGNLNKSEAFHRITSHNPDYQMPPPDSKLQLSNREKAIIIKWIEQGAQWQPHWSFMPISQPRVPDAKNEWTAFNPIDNFVQEKLINTPLSPNPLADTERLLRRVTMDLTGLPPTLTEIEDFLADDTPDAYEKVVDRLLSSPAHAERLAMDWLDIARYADSHGFGFDGYRYAWPYRDWVINAFNNNLPYDQFITWQVAGDLLDHPNQDQLIATSFYRQNPLETGMGSIDEEFRMEYIAERTATTGTAFLGLTVGCARCHDHKFDPVTQKEFYQLSAFFNNTEEMGLAPNDALFPPTLLLYNEEEKTSIDSLDRSIKKYELLLQKKKQEITEIKAYVADLSAKKTLAGEIAYFPFDRVEQIKRQKKKSEEDTSTKVEYEQVLILDNNQNSEGTLGVTLEKGKYGQAASFDGEYDYVKLKETGIFEHYDPFSVSTWVKTNAAQKGPTQTIVGNSNAYPAFYRGWDLFLDSTNHVTVRLIHRLPDDLIEVVTQKSINPGTWTQVGFSYDGSTDASGVSVFIDGKKQSVDILNDRLERTIRPVAIYTIELNKLPLRVGKSYRLWTFDVGLFNGSIDEIRIFDRQVSPYEMRLLAENSDDPSPTREMVNPLISSPEIENIQNELKNLRRLRTELKDSVPEVMIMREMDTPRTTHLLNRGVYNQPLEVVEPGTPSRVLPFPDNYPGNRLGLAKWLTDPNNPLTSRVIINRYWALLFGKGIVGTPEDFGSQGDLPTHPELLSWLAAEFMKSNWDLRNILKLMVMSYTYQQSSLAEAAEFEFDPDNQYYARSESYRWPAEFIRDNVLASSGLLHNKLGGPSVKPYQPDGVWEELAGGSYKLSTYEPDSGANLYRRTLYTFVRRFAPHPFLINFDATNREICTPRRGITNTPLQALTLLNDPQIVEASRILSEKMQSRGEDQLEDQITLGYRLTTGLSPTIKQLDLLKQQYHTSYQYFEKNPSQVDSLLSVGMRVYDLSLNKTKTAALAMVANTIFNMDEFYMKR